MSHEITKINAQIAQLKKHNENTLSMVRNTTILLTQLRADLESLKAEVRGGKASSLPNRDSMPQAAPVPEGVGGKVPE